MRIKVKTAAVAAVVSALTVALPAAAHTNPNHPNGTANANSSNHSSGSHRCVAHEVAYIVSGKVDSSQATKPAITVTNGIASSGMLQVDVTRTNHWARNAKTASAPVGFQLGLSTAVRFGAGTTGFLPGERVHLIGKVSVVTNKHCAGAGSVGTPTLRMVVVHPAAS